MDFSLSQAQQMTRRAMREFVRKEVMPLAGELDQKAEFPLSQYKKALGLEILEITLPESLDGLGDDFVSFVIALEEFACGNAALAFGLALTEAIMTLLHRYGSQRQISEYLPELKSGRQFAAVAGLSGGTASGSSEGIKAAADGTDYLLDGTIPYVPMLPLANRVLVFASTGGQQHAVFILNAQESGFDASEPQPMLGMCSLPVGGLQLNHVRVSAEDMLGSESDARIIHDTCAARIETVVGTLAIGIARAGLEEAVRHSKNRIQFGRPLAHMDATRNKIANMAAGIEAARLMVYQAASLVEKPKGDLQSAPMAKLIASEMAAAVCNEAVQIHGGYGYIKDYPVERLYRDALFTKIYSATNEIQRMKIAEWAYRKIN